MVPEFIKWVLFIALLIFLTLAFDVGWGDVIRYIFKKGGNKDG